MHHFSNKHFQTFLTLSPETEHYHFVNIDVNAVLFYWAECIVVPCKVATECVFVTDSCKATDTNVDTVLVLDYVCSCCCIN